MCFLFNTLLSDAAFGLAPASVYNKLTYVEKRNIKISNVNSVIETLADRGYFEKLGDGNYRRTEKK